MAGRRERAKEERRRRHLIRERQPRAWHPAGHLRVPQSCRRRTPCGGLATRVGCRVAGPRDPLASRRGEQRRRQRAVLATRAFSASTSPPESYPRARTNKRGPLWPDRCRVRRAAASEDANIPGILSQTKAPEAALGARLRVLDAV